MDPVDSERAQSAILPEKPIEPLDSECCGTGCTPCVFDLYKKQLSKWEKECEQILNGEIPIDLTDEHTMSPYKYKEFELADIVKDPDAVSVKTFNFICTPCDALSKQSIRKFPVDIGQHVVIKIGSVSRKYTILRVNKNNTFDILVKIYPAGAMTQILDKLKIKDRVHMRGPFGDALKYEPNCYKTVVMLAGGTGLAPMFSIIETILQNEDDETRLQLFFCSKGLSDIFLRNKQKEWADFWNFQVVHYLSNDADQEKVPYGMKVLRQRLNYECLHEYFQNQGMNSKMLYFICGTKSFEKDMVNYLSKLGVDNKDVLVF